MTQEYGIVIFTGYHGEPVDPEMLRSHYAGMPPGDDYVWGQWRPATLDELVKTWPSRSGPKAERAWAVWWQPTIDELRAARKRARTLERRRSPST
jgi:hypothetical protein